LDPEVVGLDPEVVGLDPEVVGLDPEVVGLDPEVVGLGPGLTSISTQSLMNPSSVFSPSWDWFKRSNSISGTCSPTESSTPAAAARTSPTRDRFYETSFWTKKVFWQIFILG
jgi:hypothetical protein